jgi:hypothetical protein
MGFSFPDDYFDNIIICSFPPLPYPPPWRGRMEERGIIKFVGIFPDNPGYFNIIFSPG